LQKFGRANEKTPAKWNTEYKDFNRLPEDGSSLPVAQTTSTAEVLAAPAIPATGISSAEQAAAEGEMDVDAKSSKKRKSRGEEDDETPEDKAERKRKKKEEKAAKKAKKEKRKSKTADSDSD
jgi:H/ACA ribonucleoprotein complex subunit 4